MTAGTATVTATSHNNVKVNLVINVYRHVESVTLSDTALTMVHYDTAQLTVSIAPEAVYDSSVIWTSSDPEKLSVSEDGVLTALQLSDEVITVTATSNDGGITAECRVTIIPVALEGISLSVTELTLERERTAPVAVTFTPANADNKTVTWTSSKASVATVDGDGNVTAVSDAGIAVITCTSQDGGFSGIVTVTAEKVHLVSAQMDETAIEIEHYAETDIAYTINPTDADITSAVWSVSNPETVYVSQNGHLRALAVGTSMVTLTLTDSFGTTISCSCEVEVTPVRVTSVEISVSELKLRVGGSKTVGLSIYPENADNKNVTWTSNNGVVTIQQQPDGALILAGEVAGETTITVTSEDGEYTSECKVYVYEALDISAAPNFVNNTLGNDIVWTIEAINLVGEASYNINVTRNGESILSTTAYNSDTGVVIEEAAEGTYVLNVTLNDSDGGEVFATSTVNVSEGFTFTDSNNIVWSYKIVNAQGTMGAAIKLVSMPAGTTQITVPETMDGAPVVRIDTEAFLNQTALVSVSVPETTTEIGARAFMGCTSLTTFTNY